MVKQYELVQITVHNYEEGDETFVDQISDQQADYVPGVLNPCDMLNYVECVNDPSLDPFEAPDHSRVRFTKTCYTFDFDFISPSNLEIELQDLGSEVFQSWFEQFVNLRAGSFLTLWWWELKQCNHYLDPIEYDSSYDLVGLVHPGKLAVAAKEIVQPFPTAAAPESETSE